MYNVTIRGKGCSIPQVINFIVMFKRKTILFFNAIGGPGIYQSVLEGQMYSKHYACNKNLNDRDNHVE